MKKTLTKALCLLLTLCLLSACGAAAETETAEVTEAAEAAEAVETEETTEVAEAAADEAETEIPDYYAVMAAGLDAYAEDAVVMRVNGGEVTWDLYYYWITDLLSSYCGYMGGLPEDFSEAFSDEQTLDDLFRSYASSYSTYYMAILTNAGGMGIELSEADRAALRSDWEEMCETYGGEEALIKLLRESSITENAFFFYNSFPYLSLSLRNVLYGENGEKITQEEIDAYVAENGLVRAKHILLMSSEDEAENASVQERIQTMREELAALAVDPEALEARFDALAEEYSEDPGLASYPDGYTFGSGEMVAAFEEAAFALDDYGLSEVVETDYGYHILLRLPIDADVVVTYNSSTYEPASLRTQVMTQLFSDLTSRWADEAEVVVDPAFEDFSLQTLYYGA